MIDGSTEKTTWLYVPKIYYRQFSIFCLAVGFMLSIYFILLPDMANAVENSNDSIFISVPFFILWAIAALIYIQVGDIKFDTRLWAFVGGWQHFFIFLAGTVTLLLFATFFHYLTRERVIKTIPQHSGVYQSLVIALVYTVFVPVQEFVARGVLLETLLTYLAGRLSVIFSILGSAVIYSLLHLYLDTVITLMALLPGVIWGWMYWKTRSLLLVSFSHAICGLYTIFYLKLL